jgi:lipid A 4'-phosphatase
VRAAASLAAGTILGTLLGFGRMAAGGHFLSDVVWSGLIALGVAHVLYYYVLRMPAREDLQETLYPWIERSRRARAAAIAAAILLCAGILGGGILASPHYLDLAGRIRPADYPAAPETFEIRADTLDVVLMFADKPPREIECAGYVHGFGLPTNKFHAAWEYRERPDPALRYLVSRSGWFTDIDGVLRIRLPRQSFRKIIVRISRGDITVIDDTGGKSAPGRLPALELHTADGRVVQCPPRE